MSDGLREAIAEALADEGLTPGEGIYADAILALPELAALRAKADGYDRARELVAFYDRHEYSSLVVDDLRYALDGEQR